MMNLIKVVILIFFTGLYSCEFKNERHEYAEMLIEKVEAFKKINNRLPKDVTEIGLVEEMDSPAFYQIETDSTYMVYYGLSLGESNTYKSSTKDWHIGG
ncbi:hypothetical protein [Wenyingzhuangia sp. IMCC45574]